MSQTKLGSWTETITNTAVGFGINYVANLLILPFFVVGLTYSGAFWMGIIFTVISVVRGYIMRRIFNSVKAKWNVVEDAEPTSSPQIVQRKFRCQCKTYGYTLEWVPCLDAYVCKKCGRMT